MSGKVEPVIPVTSSARRTLERRRLWDALGVVALAAVYVLAARAGLMLDAVGGFATLVWPPSGIALAALLLFGNRRWPGILLGAALANAWVGAPLPVAVGIGIGNTLEALLGAFALRRIPGFRLSLDRLPDVLGLIVLAGAVSTAVSASIGVGSLSLGGVLPPGQIGEAWRAWWLGDFIGVLLIAPVILVWATHPHLPTSPRRVLEAAALALMVGAASLLIFGESATLDAGNYGQAYLFFPPLIWAALRFAQKGAVTTAFAISAIAVWGTVAGLGPFVRAELHHGLFSLQTFMGLTATTFLVFGASVAERRRAVDGLREANAEQQRLDAERDLAHQRLVTVLEQSPLAIAIADAPTGRFLFVNEEVERLIGQRPGLSKAAEPEGSGFQGFHPDGRMFAPHEWPIARALQRGEVVRNEIMRVEREDGHTLEITVNAAPVRDTSGKVIAAVMIFWDVTAQRRADEELRRAHERAETANRVKAEFLAVVSHELRTPLNAISGYVELMSLGLQGPLTTEQQDSLARIQRNQQHLLTLIDDVLGFAKIEAGHLSVSFERVHVCEALQALELLIEPEIRKKELTFTRAPCDASLSARADPEKLRQILINFVANAIKFTPPGGRITVGAERDGRATGKAEMVRIWVRDTGIGIAADQVERVFEPFFQVESGMTRRYSGVGLGLAISRDLARAMGGDLQLESTVGEGSTVSLLLPMER